MFKAANPEEPVFFFKGVEDFVCDDWVVLDVFAMDRGSLPWGDEFREENFKAVG